MYHRLSAVSHGCMGGALCSRRRTSTSSFEGEDPQRRATSVPAPSRAVVANPLRVSRASQTTCAQDFGAPRRSSPALRTTEARRRFVTAVRRVINLLRLRRRWAAYGRILQQYPRSDLWIGLERRRGRLVRAHSAPIRPTGDSDTPVSSAEIVSWITALEAAKGKGKGTRQQR